MYLRTASWASTSNPIPYSEIKEATLEDIEDAAEALQDEETEAWTEYDADDIEEDEDVETESEEELEEAMEEKSTDVEAESEMIDETDIMTKFMMEFEAIRTKDSAIKAEDKKTLLRHLIRVERKKDDDVSEETPITPEDEDVVSDRVSTESSIHPCLREIDISDSQLEMVNPYTVYQVPNDPGLLPAFWLLREGPQSYSPDGVQKFYDAARRVGLRPIGSLKDMLMTDHLNLRYYGFGSPVMRAICDALADNTFVRKLDLKDNKLSSNACGYLNNLLLRNNTITDLSLSGCQIGPNGAKKLCDAVSENTTLKTLDLGGCNIGNEGLGYIASALSNNEDLESLNLSDNHLDKTCSENLRDLLSHAIGLTHLDLSWNSLYNAKIWKALVDGFKKNGTLRSLNLSWNALEQECVPYLYRLLSRSQNIERLDLSWNRFTEDDAEIIAKALSRNSTLQELRLGNNPLRAQGASNLVHAVTPHQSPNSALRLLDLENVWASKDVIHNLEIIEKHRPWVTIKLGGILSNYRLVGPNVRRILLKRANYEAMLPKRKRRRRNFGHFVMSLKDKKVSRTKFTELVQKFRLKLSTSLVNEIMNAFEGPNNTVNRKLLKSFYLEEYPEAAATLLKLKKKKLKTAK
ncbi:PREDICTED: leucine-rich repeat-containing protein 74A-like [Vollenhovia emeryi]|uniref:leucine-rich repeat-containing protein 74A-like n=1 Tax=Vollenhovia emeryi TaxID=411798 RepID=UPI0005F414C3|nr:PREDICTED: leucine-rich repeat-containing protein 74A-like [Vollenhovia emeryi]